MYCGKCGKEINNLEGVCTNCRKSSQETPQESEQERNQAGVLFRKWKWVLIPVLILCLLGGSYVGYKALTKEKEPEDAKKEGLRTERVEKDNPREVMDVAASSPQTQEQSLKLQECAERVREYLTRDDYDGAYSEIQNFQIEQGEPDYAKYQELLSVITMRPVINEIDSSGFPRVTVTLNYEGDIALTADDLSLLEMGTKIDGVKTNFLPGKVKLEYIAQDAENGNENRDLRVTISVGGFELGANSDYDTPVLQEAEVALISTDLSKYPKVKAYIRIKKMDTGEQVERLTPMDFVIKEQIEGGAYLAREIKSVHMIKGNTGVNIALIADKSDSINDLDMEKIKEVMIEFVSKLQFNTGDKAEVIAFDSIVQQMCTYTNNPERLINGIQSMSTDGMTMFYDAVYAGVNHAALQGGARCAIAFTDGVDNMSQRTAEQVIRYANEKQVPLYIIGVGDVEETILRDMAARTNGRYWNINDLYDLQEIYRTIYREQQEMYVVEYESDSSLDAYLSRELTVKVAGGGYLGECTAEFTPTKTLNDHGGVAVSDSRYEIFIEDISWEEANQKCQERGGHLITITSQDEMDQAIKLAEATKATHVWIGGYTSYDESGQVFAHWITGEEFAYSAWCEGEPSRQDLDGVDEWYLMLWNIKKLGGWSWNDQRNNPVADYPNLSGKIAYICEYE